MMSSMIFIELYYGFLFIFRLSYLIYSTTLHRRIFRGHFGIVLFLNLKDELHFKF